MPRIKDKTIEIISYKIRDLCIKYELPIPYIKESLPTDQCDVTDISEIRLNIIVSGNIEADYYAKHIFAHYLCGLEQTSISDKIADLIVSLLNKP